MEYEEHLPVRQRRNALADVALCMTGGQAHQQDVGHGTAQYGEYQQDVGHGAAQYGEYCGQLGLDFSQPDVSTQPHHYDEHHYAEHHHHHHYAEHQHQHQQHQHQQYEQYAAPITDEVMDLDMSMCSLHIAQHTGGGGGGEANAAVAGAFTGGAFGFLQAQFPHDAPPTYTRGISNDSNCSDALSIGSDSCSFGEDGTEGCVAATSSASDQDQDMQPRRRSSRRASRRGGLTPFNQAELMLHFPH